MKRNKSSLVLPNPINQWAQNAWTGLSIFGLLFSLVLTSNYPNLVNAGVVPFFTPQQQAYMASQMQPGMSQSMYFSDFYRQSSMYSQYHPGLRGPQLGQWRQPAQMHRPYGYNPFQDPMFMASVRSQWNATTPMGSSYRVLTGTPAIQNRAWWDYSSRATMGF